MKTIDMEVVDIRAINGDGKLKAFADVKFADSLVVKGFCVMQGSKGVFVSMPRKASKDGRWFDTLEIDESLKKLLQEKVLKAYGSQAEPSSD